MSEDWSLRLTGVAGLVVFHLLALGLSENRRAATRRWGLVVAAVALQFALGALILHTNFGPLFFVKVRQVFEVITASSAAGSEFVFGNLGRFFLIEKVIIPGEESPGPLPMSAVIAFNVLPLIVFVSALAAILQHFGVVQIAVRAIAWVMRRTLKTSGAETLGMALLVFLGIESVSALGIYLKNMTRSEIFVLMVGFLATIATSVMLVYASFGAEPGHLLAASLMSAPAAIAFAKLLVPETGTPQTADTRGVTIEVESTNLFDAATRGTQRGLTMALNVGAMLIVFVGLIHLCNVFTEAITGQPSTALLGYAFRPFAWLLGVPRADVVAVSELLAVKSVFNEFLAYQQLQPMIAEGTIQPRSVTIATYALCGFANPGSLGIMIGALASMLPERRSEVAQLSAKAFLAGTLAAFSTACVAGILT